ncbi:MAG: response regulator transcription factor [Bacteroidaceae bacterium]|nr:response regulator transcription factor [Bacteroidaceae bacterium]
MMEKQFTVIIVEDAKLELKGTEEIFRTEIPEADIIGVASNENELDALLGKALPSLLLLDWGLGGSTTVGVDICRRVKKEFPAVKVLVFTGELLNEKLWVDVLDAGADGITLKTGELLTKHEIYNVMAGKRNVFNQPVLEKIVERFREAVMHSSEHKKSLLEYDIDRYDECFLRHLALGYTKEMIASLKSMPFGVKSLEKRQADLIARLFPESEQRGINVTRLVVRAIELQIIDAENLEADE